MAGVKLRRVSSTTNPGRVKVLSLQIAVVVVIIGGWQLAGSEHWISTLFWSTPALIWDRAAQLFNGEQVDGGNIYSALGYTVSAALIGFVIGTVAGAAIGLSLWWSRTAERVLSPFIIIFHALPKFALAPLLILIIGLGMKSEVALAVALTIVTSLFTAQSGVRSVDPDQVRLCESLGSSRRQTFLKIVVPTTLPWIISALRINIGLALAGAIIGEMVASNNGVGHLITYASSVYDVALIWVGTALLAAVAVIMYAGVAFMEKRLLVGLHARSS
jgi:NitT/TauT family transport system permease protein